MSKIVGQLKAILGLDKSKFDSGLKGAEKSSNKFMSAIKKVGSALAAAFAVRKIVQWGKALYDAYQIQKESEVKLATIIKQRMGLGDEAVKDLMRQASAYQKIGVIGDEVQLSGMQQLATFLKQKKSLEALLPAMNNLLAQQKGSNATAMDAVGIANMMGKVLEGQVASLKRVGISFSAAQEEVLKTGNEMERSAMLAEVITDNVGNMNEELRKTDLGKVKSWKNIWGDFQEFLGSKMLPVLGKLADWGSNFVDKLMPKQSVALKKEQSEINNLVDALTNENTSREVRESLISELQQKYPNFLGNLDAETATNENLRDRLQEVNKEYEDKIKLAVQEELVSRQGEKYADSLEKEQKAAKKLAETQKLLERTQEDINKETNPDILVALIDKQNVYEGNIERLTKKIKKEQEYRENLNKEIEETIALLGDLGKAGTSTTGGGGTTGGTGTAAGVKTPGITSEAPAVTGLLGMSDEELADFARTEAAIDKMIGSIAELSFEGETLGNTMEFAFGSFSNMIADSMFVAGDSMEAFGKLFADFVKNMIARLVAATIAAAVLAVVLSIITGGGASVGGIFKGMKSFGEFFKAGFGKFSGFGMASGGTVPMGFPNDTFPAMLTSRERVLTPAENKAYESGTAGNIKLSGEFRIKGKDLVLVYDETKRRAGRVY